MESENAAGVLLRSAVRQIETQVHDKCAGGPPEVLGNGSYFAFRSTQSFMGGEKTHSPPIPESHNLE